MANSNWLVALADAANGMPGTNLSKQRKEKIETCFSGAGARVNAEKYMTFGMVASFAIAFVVSIALYIGISAKDMILLPVFFIVVFALSTLGLLNLPALLFENSRRAMEADLPLAIRHAGIAISIHLPFEKVVEEIGEAGYGCSKSFKRAKNAMASGQTLQHALLGEAALARSRKLSRFVSSIISLYEEGGEPVSLYMLADEYSKDNIAVLKEFAQKAVFGGLVFVAAACIVPAFYMIYGVISSAMPLGFDPPGALSAWACFLILFPLVDLGIMGFIAVSTPPSLNLRQGADGKNAAKKQGIAIAGYKISQASLFIISIAGFIVFGALGFSNSLFF
ncbi:MAG TPA: type II secretion system F family protein, partial [Candidatus Micrarchaeota archaeon]|nr:type II secretion system F family protein [Candidatus Micrarchaeota archaeon]